MISIPVYVEPMTARSVLTLRESAGGVQGFSELG